MFKKVLLVLLALIAAFVIYVALQPDAYKVERSVTIAAPADQVFENVNNLRKWEAGRHGPRSIPMLRSPLKDPMRVRALP